MNRELSPEQLRAVAYHEAGHTVVMLSLGMPFSKVSIAPNDQNFGRCEPGGQWKWAKRENEGEPARLVRYLHLAILYLSGDVAEATVTYGRPFTIMPLRGEQGIRCLDKDRPAADWICKDIVNHFGLGGGGSAGCGDTEEKRIVEHVLQWATMALVEKHWQEVEAVAQALQDRGELTSEQVASVCAEAKGSEASKRVARTSMESTTSTPDGLSAAEAGRMLSLLRVHSAGGRPPVETPCPKCGVWLPSARQARGHCAGPKRRRRSNVPSQQ